jgi:RNA polymerase sigma factor (sigma-70 family)
MMTQRVREKFFTLARRQLGTLYRFVRHEIAYAESSGDLIAGELAPEEVVDAVIVRAYRAFPGESATRSTGWLIGMAREQIEAEIARTRRRREEEPVHLEQDIPESPPAEAVSTLGEEILYFYQPDEDLKLEDVIPDLAVASPEQQAQALEQRALVRSLLVEMPSEQRRALMLRYAEGLSPSQVGAAIGRSRREVEELLEEGRRHLRRGLEEPTETLVTTLGAGDRPVVVRGDA